MHLVFCRWCKESQPVENFPQWTVSTKRGYCRKCYNEYSRKSKNKQYAIKKAVRQKKETEVLLKEARESLSVPESTKETDWAWVASQMDGEGTISIRSKHRAANRKPTIAPLVQWVSTDFSTTRHIQEIIGCGRIFCGRNLSRETHQARFTLLLSESTCRLVVLRMIPYLVTKLNQARLLVRFTDLRKSINTVEQTEFMDAMFRLNHPTPTDIASRKLRVWTPGVPQEGGS